MTIVIIIRVFIHIAVDNPRGGFCCPWFPGRNEIWNVVYWGKDNWRTLRKKRSKDEKQQKPTFNARRPFIEGPGSLTCP